MPSFTGTVGPVDANGYFDWTKVIIVVENGAIVDFFTNWSGDTFANPGDDVSINGFKVKLTQGTYDHFGNEAVGARNLTIGAGTQLAMSLHDFTASGSLTNSGSITTTASMIVTGSIQNDHLITVSGQYNFLKLAPVGGDFTLSGSGDLRLVNGFITGFGGQSSITDLFNQSRISGSGTIGSEFNWLAFPGNGGYLVIHNTASGVIEANRAGETLRIHTETSAVNPVDNQGTMAASNGGKLEFVGSTIVQSGAGTLTAHAGSVVSLNNAVVTGGTLHGQGGGIVESGGSTTKLVDLDISRTAIVKTGRSITFEGAIENRGTILADDFNGSLAIAAAGLTLSGRGQVKLVGAYDNSTIHAPTANTVFTNLDNTISGVGEIAGGNLTFVNDGRVSARPDSYRDPDVLSLDSLAGITNTGILEASGGAQLVIQSPSTINVANAGGVIQAIGAGSVVGLGNALVTGGRLNSSGGGVIGAGGSNTRLTDVELSASTIFDCGSQVFFEGDVVNRGQIQIGRYFYVGTDGLTLTGGGQLVLFDGYFGSGIFAEAAGAVLRNNDNLIRGDGDIAGGNLTLVNDGTIRADADPYNDYDRLRIDDLAALTNTGILEARNGATLELGNTAAGFIRNAGGTIQAVGDGSVVNLMDSVIFGGTLKGVSGGRFALGTNTFDGRASAVTLDADMAIDRSTLTLKGAVANKGVIAVSQSALSIAENTVLSGDGTITLSGGFFGASAVVAGVAGRKLANAGNTISGDGALGAGSGLVFANQAGGIVSANHAGATLALNTGNTIRNDGVLKADGGILDVYDKVVGSGSLVVTGGGVVVVDRNVDHNVRFEGAGADTLALSLRGSATGYDFSIAGMGVGDRIKLLDVGGGAGATAAFEFQAIATGGILTSALHADRITLSGTVSEGHFRLMAGADGRFGYERVATRDGTAAGQTMIAAASGERLVALGGDDILVSGARDDVLDGSTGIDTADFRNAASGVRVSLAIDGPQAVSGRLGNDHLMSIENLTGSRFGDTLTGDAGINGLKGAAGRDTLNGGAGGDSLMGGLDGDTFVFAGAFGIDTITDWQDNRGAEASYDNLDRISLHAFRGVNGGLKVTLDDLLITSLGTRDVQIELDLDGNNRADRLDLDGNGSLDTARIIVKNASVANFGAADFLF